MTDRKTEEEALEKFRKMLIEGEASIFSKEEVNALRDVLRVYRGIQALGWLGTGIRNVVLLVMFFITTYAALTGALSDWIKKISL